MDTFYNGIMDKLKRKPVFYVNIALVIMETIALIYDCYSFGFGLFKWYTIDSNVLQLIVSCFVLFFIMNGKPLPKYVTIMHFISAVCLTVTFIIAAFVLAPEGGIPYYFLENVAPINHFLAPLLSVISLLFLEKTEKISMPVTILWPIAATLCYGLICLILNIINVLEGPYFFLRVNEQPITTVVMWFAIIGVLCALLSLIYYKIKWRKKNK